MRETRRYSGPVAIIVASGIFLTPVAANAQFFAGPPPTRVTPTPTPVIQQIAPTITPVQTQTTIVAPAQPKLDQPINIPTFFTNSTILPSDTVRDRMPDESLDNAPGAPKGTGVSRATEFTDLKAFLRSEGWEADIPGSDASQLLSEDDAIEEDSNFAEPEGGLVPVAFVETGSAVITDKIQPVVIRVNEAAKHFWVFTADDQMLTSPAGCKKAVVSGSPGTVIGSRDGVLTLHKGLLLVDSGSGAVKVAAKEAGLKLPPDSTAAVEYNPGQSVTVRIIGLHGTEKAKVRFAIQAKKVFELSQGDEVSVDLTKPASQSIEVVAAANDARVEQMLKESAGKTEHGKPLRLYSCDGTRFLTSRTGHIGLLSGRMLVQANAPQVVRTQLGDVYIQKGGIVSLERWQGEFRAACCSSPKSAIFVSANFGVPMTWGLESLVLDHEPTWSDAFPSDNIGRRFFELHNVKANKLIIDDFSLPALILHGSHFQEVRKDSQLEVLNLRLHLLKTAAALQMVTGYKGQYATEPPAIATKTQSTTK